MAISLRHGAKAAIRLARLTPRLFSLLVVATLGAFAANGMPAQPDDDERRTEVVYRHFV